MLKINIVCVGNIKEVFYENACAEYLKRLSRFCTISIKELKEQNIYENPAQIIEMEGEQILNHLKGYIVVMDIDGKQFSSEQFAKKIEEISAINSEITFVIGGSYGICEKVKKKANLRLSFSNMTFPHMLFRVMLLEQIYRAFTINNNIKYHK